jgi:pilus assembly protein CpaE
MFVQLNCAIVDANAENRQEMAGFLASHGVQVVAEYPTAESLQQVLARPDGPILVVMNIDPNPHESLKRIAHFPRLYPQVSFFLMSTSVDAELLMEAMHAGVKEFIPLPMSETKFAAAIERVAQTQGMGKRAKVIHVVPSMGGCGSTTIACNVAASLAQQARTVLIDLNLIMGGAACYFDLRPRFTIADVMDSAEKADKQLLDNALCIHKNSGLAVLARPDLPEDTQRVNQAGLSRLMGILTRIFEYVVIDSVMSVDPIYATAISAADINLIVMQLNVPSARNAERFVGALRRKGIESSKIQVVINRFERKNRDIEPEAIERALGLKIGFLIPNDFKNALAATNFGEPVVLRAPKSEMSVALREMAKRLGVKTSSQAAAA